jgi:DNA-directed RNA polymerase subunit F
MATVTRAQLAQQYQEAMTRMLRPNPIVAAVQSAIQYQQQEAFLNRKQEARKLTEELRSGVRIAKEPNGNS